MKKFKNIAIIVLSVLVLLAGLLLALAGVGSGWVFVVIGALLIVWQKALDKKAKKAAAEDAEREAYRQKKKSVEIMLPVVGVKYENDDGTDRQHILHTLCDDDGSGVANVTLEEYDYEGAPAIHVVTAEGCVGNVRAVDVEKVLPLIGGKWLERPSIYITEENGTYQADLFLYPADE